MVFYENISSLSSAWFNAQGQSHSRWFVVCDETTVQECWPKIEKIFPNATIFTMSSGEANKSLSTVNVLYQWLFNNEAKRSDAILAVGGGVVCDVVGFVASTFKRGMKCWYVPTTLLAMVDAAHGGKTGVNYNGLKNQIGTFSEPENVVIDTRFLGTLSKEELRSGKAEMLKHGLIRNAAHFQEITADNQVSAEHIATSVALKMEIVSQDFKEEGKRAWLNFGHTVGHAFESFCAERNSRTHGDCVAAGMLVEAKIALKRKVLNVEDFNVLVSKVTSIFPKIEFLRTDIGVLLDVMKHDKKNMNAQVKVVLLEKLGKVHSVAEVSEEEMFQALDDYLNTIS